jgi:hypothetical protein
MKYEWERIKTQDLSSSHGSHEKDPEEIIMEVIDQLELIEQLNEEVHNNNTFKP